MIRDLEQGISRLKEMVQFGVGETFADRMDALRANGKAMRELLPFVSFGPDESIKCWPFPVPGDSGYDLFLLLVSGITAFPNNKSHKYRYQNTLQTIYVLSGSMQIHTKKGVIKLKQNDVQDIAPNTPVRIVYKSCAALFKISPKVDFQDFFFE